MSDKNFKYSGIEWIGMIPDGWQIKRLKEIVKIINGGTPESDFIFEEKNDNNIYWATPADFFDIHDNFDKTKRTVLFAKRNQASKTLKKNSILLSSRAPVGKVAYLINDMIINQGCKGLNVKKLFHSKYYFYHLIISRKNLEDLSKGTTFNEISTNSLKHDYYVAPSLSTQTAIANYLDHQTSKIVNEISLLEKKVEMLTEYKQALIFETVTKGLDKNVKMKDSGIEWIGMIPEHWEVRRVSNFFTSQKTITKQGCIDVLSLTLSGVIEKDIENNKGLNPESYDTYQVFKKNDLVFKLIDLENYQTSRVGRVWKNGIMSSAYIRLSKKNNTNIDYFYYQFFDLYKRAIFNMLGGNGVRSAINKGDLLKLSIVVPYKNEQKKIANYLDIECDKIDNKKELINKKIELLKEYKQSLIYESVTGKNKDIEI